MSNKKGGAKPKEVRQYSVNETVLGKIRGYPPWPGIIVDVKDVPDAVANDPGRKPSFHCIQFFPTGDYGWIHPKDLSSLRPHEIDAYLASDGPRKRTGDLAEGYAIAKDPSAWMKQRRAEVERQREALAGLESGDEEDAEGEGEGEEGGEVDELASEGGEGGGAQKSRKRKRASAAADEEGAPKKKKSTSASASKSSAKEPKAKKEKATKSTPPTEKKKRTSKAKSKAVVESEDEADADGDGEADADADADADAEAEADADAEADAEGAAMDVDGEGAGAGAVSASAKEKKGLSKKAAKTPAKEKVVKEKKEKEKAPTKKEAAKEAKEAKAAAKADKAEKGDKGKAGKEDEDGEGEGKAPSDPQSIAVRDWRHKLQKTFLSQKAMPKADAMKEIDALFTTVEAYEDMTIEQLQFSKIGKVMRHIAAIPDEKAPPLDDMYAFRMRAKGLVDRWHGILNANKPANGTASAATETKKPSSPGKKSASPTKEKEVKDKEREAEAEVIKATNGIDLNGPEDEQSPAAAIAAAYTAQAEGDMDAAAELDADETLGDITMSEVAA